MLPVGLLAAIGIDIGSLVETAGFNVPLQQALGIARTTGPAQGVFSRFRGQLAAAGIRSPWFTPSELYRAAKYWTDMGSMLNKYQGPTEIDPRLAQQVNRPLSDFSPTRRYAYVFDITATDPTTGVTSIISRQVESGVPLSIDEAAAQLRELIELHGDVYQNLIDEMTGESGSDVTFTFSRFYRYSYGTV